MVIADAQVKARLAAAQLIAKRAGALALDYFHARDRLSVSHKGAQDRVSEADRNVETLIRDSLTAEFPDDAQLGEEHGVSSGTSGYCWVIDPIDGTTPFLAGLPDWCVSIAVARDAWPVVGVIEAPCHRETWVAARGQGATVNGRALRYNPDADLTTGLFALGRNLKDNADEVGRLITRLMRAGSSSYECGSGALMTAYVADGRLVGYYDASINAWDCFAGLVLVGEVGGQIEFGDETRMQTSGPMLIGAPAVFAKVKTLLQYGSRA